MATCGFLVLPGELHHEHDPEWIALPAAEPESMVGEEHDRRGLMRPGRSKVIDDIAHQAIHIPQLGYGEASLPPPGAGEASLMRRVVSPISLLVSGRLLASAPQTDPVVNVERAPAAAADAVEQGCTSVIALYVR